MATRLVTVFGGSGFIGRHLTRRLAASGARVRVAVRRPEKALFLRPMGDVGQIDLVQANIRDDASVAAAVQGADVVFNLVGILCEGGKQKFDAVQAEGATRIARASAAAGVARLVHVSAIGQGEESPSAFARSKAAGEAGVREAFPAAVIARPSLVFGPDDDFFNRFAAIARLTPVLPLFGGGGSRFQPVYVGDVADALLALSEEPGVTGPGVAGPGVAGKAYELGGPKVYTYEQLMTLVLEITGRKRFLAPVPFVFGKAAAWFLQLLPSPLLTVDQVELLSLDNVVSADAHGFDELGITPVSAETILPTYLWRFRSTGQFAMTDLPAGDHGDA